MQFEGFQSMVKTRLDKLSDLEAWPLVNGHLPGALLQQTKETTTRVSQLETRPPPPPFRMPPPRAPPRSHPSSGWLDLNMTPAQSSHQSASSSEV
jgi:hypothetical protein